MTTRNHGKEASTLANKGDLQWILYSIIMFVMTHHSARYGDDLNRFPQSGNKSELQRYKYMLGGLHKNLSI